jgi:translation initiation factor eIF-2B subunit epsilon
LSLNGQAHCVFSAERLPLFGQILAALYQEDIVEADDIRSWHSQLSSQGSGMTGDRAAHYKRCWQVGGVMLQHLSEDDSDESEEEESD